MATDDPFSMFQQLAPRSPDSIGSPFALAPATDRAVVTGVVIEASGWDTDEGPNEPLPAVVYQRVSVNLTIRSAFSTMLAPADLQTIEASLESPADRQPAVAAIGGTFMDRGGKPLLCDLTTPLGRLPSRKVRVLADIVLESARISTLPRTDRGEPVQQLKEFAADEGFDYRRQRHLFLPRLRRSQRRTAVYPPASARASFTIIRPL